jgi:hypothetical protein
VSEHRSRRGDERRLPRLGQRRAIGHERAPRPPPVGDQVAALHQGRDRLPKGRSRDAKAIGEAPLGRQPAPRREQPHPDRGPQPFHRLLERGRRADGLEDGPHGGAPLRGRCFALATENTSVLWWLHAHRAKVSRPHLSCRGSIYACRLGAVPSPEVCREGWSARSGRMSAQRLFPTTP